MKKVLNKDIGDATVEGIEYNHLNLPYKITVKGKGTITYIYDATGNKLEKITDETSPTKKQTYTAYSGSYIYENNVLQFFAQEEGRIRKKGNDFVFDYFIKDHLGNVRIVLTDEHNQLIYPAATLEDGAVPTEASFYDIKSVNIKDKTSITTFATAANNSYQNNNVIPNNNPSSNTTAISNKLYRLNGATGDKTGLGIKWQVMK